MNLTINKSINFIFSIVMLLLLTLSCGIMSPNASRLYKSFYTDSGTQYFIKPLKFSNSTSGKLKFDIVFRFNNTIQESDSVIINYSIVTDQLVKEIDSIRFNSGDVNLIASFNDRLFMEREKKQYHSRFSSSASLTPLVQLFISEQWTIEVFHNENKMVFKPTASSARKIESLNFNLFELLR